MFVASPLTHITPFLTLWLITDLEVPALYIPSCQVFLSPRGGGELSGFAISLVLSCQVMQASAMM